MSCGGGSDSGHGPSPTPNLGPAPAPGGQVEIVGERGNQSFNPNPANAPSSQMVAWRNADGTVHHIVTNDGSFDTGNIAPGATSASVTIPTGGANYHCSLHPTMIGAVNSAGGQTPPCTGIYC